MSKSITPKIENVKLPNHRRNDGCVTVFESFDAINFQIARCFTISEVPVGGTRGNHAHYKCTQIICCPTGQINIRWHDGNKWGLYKADNLETAIRVEPGVWVEVDFVKPNTVALVICDRPFEEDDYVDDFEKFKKYNKIQPN